MTTVLAASAASGPVMFFSSTEIATSTSFLEGGDAAAAPATAANSAAASAGLMPGMEEFKRLSNFAQKGFPRNKDWFVSRVPAGYSISQNDAPRPERAV